MLQDKKIVLGVCGSIAAYKSALLTRLLVKEGAEVKVIMTHASRDFISPLTLSTLSKNPVLTEFIKDDTGSWNNHVDLGLWADVMLVAPASAQTMAKFANGLCDNLLTAVYLSAKCPVILAPAMDRDMYLHPSTVNNMDKLQSYGNEIINAEHGELASGLIGTGRMAEPENILNHLKNFFQPAGPLQNKRVLITAGPTFEAIDPVRYIGNHSSGKMGYALAENFASKGATVNLVSGPTQQSTRNSRIDVTSVFSAQEMYEAVKEKFENSDIIVHAAAVADYRPKNKADQKIKKSSEDMFIELARTTDIAGALSELKRDDQTVVGFALETNNEEDNAIQKLRKKNFDFIVLNSLNDQGAGFGHDTNKITIIDRDENKEHFDLKTKKEVAEDIVQTILNKISVS